MWLALQRHPQRADDELLHGTQGLVVRERVERVGASPQPGDEPSIAVRSAPISHIALRYSSKRLIKPSPIVSSLSSEIRSRG